MKITLPSITNGQDLTTLNSNFQAIATQLNTNVFYRTNIGSEPNTISQDVDFNGHAAYNLTDLSVNGVSLIATVALAQTYAAAALNSANNAAASNTAAGVSAASASTSAAAAAASAGAAGPLKAVNNLSDLTNVATAKTNLSLVKADVGLNNVDNTSDVNKPISTATATALGLKATILNPAFTGNGSLTGIGAQFSLNDSSGTAQSLITWQNGGVAVWSLFKDSANAFNIGRYVGGVFQDSPIAVLSASGSVKIKGQIAPAPASYVGEIIETRLDTFTAMGFSANTNLVGVSLTPGIWMITGNLVVTATTITSVTAGINSVSVTLPANSLQSAQTTTGGVSSLTVPIQVLTVSANTSYFLVANITGTGSATFAGKLTAVRVA